MAVNVFISSKLSADGVARRGSSQLQTRPYQRRDISRFAAVPHVMSGTGGHTTGEPRRYVIG